MTGLILACGCAGLVLAIVIRKRLAITRYQLIQRLQNSPLTGWLWAYWQHDETGHVMLLPRWRTPGQRWSRVKWRD